LPARRQCRATVIIFGVCKGRHHEWEDGARVRERPGDDRALKPQRTKLYDRTGDAVALDEVERIAI
jgi:hypothetical protein